VNSDNKQNKQQPIEVSKQDMDELKRDMRSAHLNAWAKEHQQQIIGGLVALLIVLVGISFWKEHRDTQRASAAALYYQALNAKQNGDKRTLLKSIINDYDNTAYASLARILMAKVDSVHAETYLRALLDRTDIDSGMKAQARMDLARIKIAAGDKAAALKLLSEPVGRAYEQLRYYLMAQASDNDAERIQHLQSANDAQSYDTELARSIGQQLGALGKDPATGKQG